MRKAAAIFSARSSVRLADQQRLRALLDEVARSKVGHLACAYDQHRFPGERAEDLARKLDGDRSDRDRRAADLSFGAHALGHGKCTLQQRVQSRAEGSRGFDGADFARDVPRLLHLAEDLRFANDHGIKRGRDAEEVADGFALAECVEMRLERRGGDLRSIPWTKRGRMRSF